MTVQEWRMTTLRVYCAVLKCPILNIRFSAASIETKYLYFSGGHNFI